MRYHNTRTLAGDTMFGASLGIVGALLSLAVALAIDPWVAPLVPVALLFGLAALTQPVMAVLILIFLAYLDALGNKIFFFAPTSPFKLLTGIAVVALMLAITSFRQGIKVATKVPVFRAYGAFMLAWWVALILAQSKSQAMPWAIDLATVAVILPLIMFTLQKEHHVRWAIWLLAIASAISSVILLADVALGTRLVSTSEAATTARTAEGFDRSSGGSNENPTTAATMLLTGTIIAVVHAIESPVRRRLFIGMAVICTLGVLLSFARSAFLVYVIVGMLLAWRYRRHRLFPIASVLGAMAFVALLPFLPASFWERILSIFGGGGDWTLGRRLSYNIIGLDLFFQNPIFGVGPGNFYSIFPESEYRFLPGRTLTGRQLHNMYLSVLVEYGLVGFTCFMAMIGSGFSMCRRVMRSGADPQSRAVASALFYGMLAYFIVSVFVPNEYNKYTWILPALAGVLWLTNKSKEDQDTHNDMPQTRPSHDQ